MKLFGKKEKETACCCQKDCVSRPLVQSSPLEEKGVKVLGSGCAKCNGLEEAVRAALEELGMDTAIDHVTDFAQIAAYGVMSTPALVVDGKVLSSGRVLKKEEAVALLRKARGEK